MGMLVSSEDILCQFPDQFIRSGEKKVRLEPYTTLHISLLTPLESAQV